MKKEILRKLNEHPDHKKIRYHIESNIKSGSTFNEPGYRSSNASSLFPSMKKSEAIATISSALKFYSEAGYFKFENGKIIY
ncbi:MAG: hypothetical protein V1678_05140 [Candidatus Aenigmatarchaeota archaeon]